MLGQVSDAKVFKLFMAETRGQSRNHKRSPKVQYSTVTVTVVLFWRITERLGCSVSSLLLPARRSRSREILKQQQLHSRRTARAGTG